MLTFRLQDHAALDQLESPLRDETAQAQVRGSANQ